MCKCDSVSLAYWLQVTNGIVHGVSLNVCVCVFVWYACLSLRLFLVFDPEGYWAHLWYSEFQQYTQTHAQREAVGALIFSLVQVSV